jgi:phage FluMu gp28-like protein
MPNKDLKLLDYVMRNYFKKPSGIYDYQKDLYWRLMQNPFNLVRKSRQIGITFFYGGFTTLMAMRGEKNAIISRSLKQTGWVMDYVDSWLDAFKTLAPGAIESEIVEHNRSSIQFRNGGGVFALPNSASSVRGHPFDRLFLDEYAHFLYGSDKKVWEAIIPSLSREIKSICANSTPWGEGNMFWQMDTDRIAFPDFKSVFYHHSECPDIKIDLIKRNMDELSFMQEYEGAYLGDQTSYFPFSLTRSCIDQEADYSTDISTCQEPLYGFADIGRRRDFTAIILLAERHGKLVVVFKKVLKTEEEKRWENQYALFRTVLAAPKLMRFGIDAGFGQQLVETMQHERSVVTPFTFTNENKAQMFPAFRKKLENNGIEMPEDMEIINSLHLIQRTQSGNGVVYGSDKRNDEYGHADLAVALVGANWMYDHDANAATNIRALDSGRPRGIISPRIHIPHRR